MLSWLIPKEFCCGLICAGFLKNLNTSTVFHARIVYLSLTIFLGFCCLMVKLFGEDLYSKLSFIMPDCKEGTCFSAHIIHAFMLSLALFHLCVIGFTTANEPMASMCYQKCWVLKFLLFFGILFACVAATSALVLIYIGLLFLYSSIIFTYLYGYSKCIFNRIYL